MSDRLEGRVYCEDNRKHAKLTYGVCHRSKEDVSPTARYKLTIQLVIGALILRTNCIGLSTQTTVV